jgi:5-methylcytosine-specific restriction endonuclease McrA
MSGVQLPPERPLPRCIISSASVSDTEGPGAKPGEATSFTAANNKEQTLREKFMTDILNKNIVLVLNRNWQAINTRTPADAFCQMATSVATALDIDGDNIRPVAWDESLTLRIREQDEAVQTVRGLVRVPTVIVALNFAKVPRKRPKLCVKAIRERDGNRCQYTGKILRPDEGSMDQVLPRSRGGADSWENLVWAAKEVNARKGNRLPHEAGLRLLAVPRVPRELPVTALIRNSPQIADWDLFVK